MGWRTRLYSLSLSLRGHRNNDTPVGTNTANAQIFTSKHHSPIKGTRVPWRNGQFQDWNRENTRWCQKGRNCSKSKQGKATYKKDGSMCTGHGSQLKELRRLKQERIPFGQNKQQQYWPITQSKRINMYGSIMR